MAAVADWVCSISAGVISMMDEEVQKALSAEHQPDEHCCGS